MPKISVIIPIYNVEKYLSAALSSLKAQSFEDYEAICVDNGSTDNSLSILREYASKDNRIKIVEQNNRGVSAARNAALDQAGGEYIAFLDSDDMMHPQMLEIMLKALIETDSDIVYCDINRFKDGEKISFDNISLPSFKEISNHFESFVLNKVNNPKVALWNKLYRADLFKQIRLPEELTIAEDFVVMHSLLFAAKKISYVQAELIYYRQRSDSLIHRELKEEDIHNGITAVRLVFSDFKDKELSPHIRNRLNYRLMKMLCKDCIVTPYKRVKTNRGYLKFWDKYQPLLLRLRHDGLYQPRYLDIRNRLFSALFLKRRFEALRFCLSVF